MEIRYYIDPRTANPHIHTHDVFEQEVEEVLARPGRTNLVATDLVSYLDRPALEDTFELFMFKIRNQTAFLSSQLMNSQESHSKRTGDVRKGEYEDQ